jgi:hypothetical protein
MKKRILAAAVCVATMVGTASAQIVNTMQVTLLFDASVGGATLSAGEYIIRDVHDSGPTAVFQFYARDGRSVVAMAREIVASKHQRPTSKASMVLRPNGRGYQIQTIWLAGREIGYEFSAQ